MTTQLPHLPAGDGPRRKRSPWPYAIVGLLAAHVGAMALAVHIAQGSSGHAVLPEYRERATGWDDVRAAEERSAALGWSLTVTPAALGDGAGGRRVTLELLDSAGDPVDGAAVRVRAYHHAVGVRCEAAAEPLGRGLYAASLPMERPGDYEFDTRVTLDALEFLDTRTVTLGVLPGAAPAPKGGATGR